MNSDLINVIVIHILVFVIVYFINLKRDVINNTYIYVWPLWGIGNRLRTIRVAYHVAKITKRKICIIEHDDDGFKGSMQNMFNFPFKHVGVRFFENIICKLHDVPIIEFNEQCSYVGSITQFQNYKSFCIKACEIKINDSDMNDNSLYYLMKPSFAKKHMLVIEHIKQTRAVGVHIRQGNVNDWQRGYFFGDEWKDISIKDPTSSPQFCCFKDNKKNLSACPSNIQYIESFIEKMQTFPKETIFFVCADRPGCTMYLHQLFPNQIIMNQIDIESEKINTYKGWIDFFCLATCSQIIVSKISSFSDEARRINDITILKLK